MLVQYFIFTPFTSNVTYATGKLHNKLKSQGINATSL